MNYFRFNINTKVLVFFLFLLLSILYFMPFFEHPSLNLLDDGDNIQGGIEILRGDFSANINEIKGGRFRPVFWLYYSLIYFFSGENPLGYWIGQAVIFSLSLFLIWEIVIIINKHRGYTGKIVSFLTSCLLFFVPAISTNLYRLGTAEVRQMFFILLFIYWMLKKKSSFIDYLTGFILFSVSLFAKETSVLLLFPIYFIHSLPDILAKNKKVVYMNSLFFISSVFTIFVLMKARANSGYSSDFTFFGEQFIYNVYVSLFWMKEVFYMSFFLLSLFVSRIFLTYIFAIFKKKKSLTMSALTIIKLNATHIALSVGVLLSLYFTLAWKHQLERYYYPFFILFIIAILIELQACRIFLSQTKTFKEKNSLILLSFALWLFFSGFFLKFELPRRLNYMLRNNEVKQILVNEHYINYEFIKYVLNTKQKIYVLEDADPGLNDVVSFAKRIRSGTEDRVVITSNLAFSKTISGLSYSADPVNEFITDGDHDSVLVTKSAHLFTDNSVVSIEELKPTGNTPNRTDYWVVYKKR